MKHGRPFAPSLALFAASLSFGCVELGRRATASPDEYAVYRRFRTAPSLERKLAAGFDYLRAHPDGAWHDEVSRWFDPAEHTYVTASWNDLPKLEAFVKAVPDGEPADQANRRIVELELTNEFQAKSELAFETHAHEVEQRLETAEAGRRSLISGFASWIRRLAGIRTWGGRTSDLDHELIFAYRLSEPAARCDENGCTKTVVVDYAVPEGKAQSAREAVYDVNLTLEHGGVQGASIVGSELFTRLGEAARVAAVPTTDLVARSEAIGQAAQMIALAAEPVMPSSRCAAEAVSPVVLRRACDGVELLVVSAVELGQEDRVTVRPLPPAP